jgi:hypothetical protein
MLCPSWGLLLQCDGCCLAVEAERWWCLSLRESMSHMSSTRARARRTRLGVADLRPGGALLFDRSLPWVGWSRASGLQIRAIWLPEAPHPSKGYGNMPRSSWASLLGLAFYGHRSGSGEHTEPWTEDLIRPTAQHLLTQLQGVGWFWGCVTRARIDWGVELFRLGSRLSLRGRYGPPINRSGGFSG